MQDARFWDRAAPRYARSPISNMPAYEATLARVRDHLKDTDAVLEVGCGTGSTALNLAGAVAHYTATDLSPGMIDIARQKAAAARTPNLDFQVGGADLAGFAADRFDAVLAFNLLHLVRDLDGALARARAVLKPGGIYISKTACLKEMNPLIRVILPLMQLVGKAPFVQSLTHKELERRVAGAGFEILVSETFVGAPSSRFLIARKA